MRVLGLTLVFLLLAVVAFYMLMMLGAFIGLALQEAGVGLSDLGVNIVAWTCGGLAAIAVLVIGVRMQRS